MWRSLLVIVILYLGAVGSHQAFAGITSTEQIGRAFLETSAKHKKKISCSHNHQLNFFFRVENDSFQFRIQPLLNNRCFQFRTLIFSLTFRLLNGLKQSTRSSPTPREVQVFHIFRKISEE